MGAGQRNHIAVHDAWPLRQRRVILRHGKIRMIEEIKRLRAPLELHPVLRDQVLIQAQIDVCIVRPVERLARHVTEIRRGKAVKYSKGSRGGGSHKGPFRVTDDRDSAASPDAFGKEQVRGSVAKEAKALIIWLR